MSRSVACVSLALACAPFGIIAGCNTAPVLNEQLALREAAVPCSVHLELLVTWPSQGKAERYSVHRGILGWSGGSAALQGRSTWEAALSAESCAKLEASIASLCAAVPPSGPRDSQQDQFDLNFWCGGRSHRVMAAWPDPGLGDLPAELQALAAARLGPALDKLPVAGQRLE